MEECYEFEGKIFPTAPINSNFTMAKCYVMHIGKNQNRLLNFPKEAIDDAVSTIGNVPIVAHIYEDDEGIHLGGHDKVLVQGDDGKYKFKSLPIPVGVVPENNNARYEEVEEANGEKHTYLVVDIILWTGRFPELWDVAYNEEKYYNQSMEVNFLDIQKKSDGFTDINKFQFSALCLLGKSDVANYNVNPAFPSASVTAFSLDNEEWSKLLKEFKEELAKAFSEQENLKGGKGVMTSEQIENILHEFSIDSRDTLNFEIGTDMTEDELRAKLKEQFEAQTEDVTVVEESNKYADFAEPQEDAAKQEPVQEPVKFQLDVTYEEKRCALCDAVKALCYWDEHGYSDYYLNDFTDKYVYVEYRVCVEGKEEDKGCARFDYMMQDGKAVLSLETKVPVKRAWITQEDEAKLAATQVEFEELKQYKTNRIEEDRKQQYGNIIEQFSDLAEQDEYKTIVGKSMEFATAEDLEKELFALRGKLGVVKVVKKNVSNIRIPIEEFAEQTTSLAEKERAFMKQYSPAAHK